MYINIKIRATIFGWFTRMIKLKETIFIMNKYN